MVCYTVPLVAAITHLLLKRNIAGWKANINHQWLSLLLIGGSVFGLVDHLWNGELFLLTENLAVDIMLGITITIAILIVWTIVILLNKTKQIKKIKI